MVRLPEMADAIRPMRSSSHPDGPMSSASGRKTALRTGARESLAFGKFASRRWQARATYPKSRSEEVSIRSVDKLIQLSKVTRSELSESKFVVVVSVKRARPGKIAVTSAAAICFPPLVQHAPNHLPGSLGRDNDFGLDLLVKTPAGCRRSSAFVSSASNALVLWPNNGLAELDIE